MTFTHREKVAQFFLPAAFIHDSEENYKALENLIRKENIGGLTFFHSRHSAAANFEKRAEALTYEETLKKMIGLINRYQKVARTPLLISIDAEYGLAMRIENTPQYPFAISLGALQTDAHTKVEEVGFRMGKDLKRAGIHLNFAPCADVNTNPNNPVIGYRSFGDEVMKVADLALANYQGMKRAGIGACMKHFPGHGDTAVDSHLGLPVLQKSRGELEAEELAPFKKGIANGVEMIMVGHLAVPALTDGKDIPASISSEIITDLLKKEMGFGGLVVSDALNMKAVANLFPTPGELELKAFEAGNDLLCFSDHVEVGIEKIASACTVEKIESVFEKVMTLKKSLGVLDFEVLNVPEFDWKSHSTFQSQLASDYVKVIQGDLNTFRLNSLAQNKKLAHRTFFGKSPSLFSELLNKHFDQNLEENSLEGSERVLISAFIPSHKPLNNFGMEDAILEEIKNIAKSKPTVLVHFGNPLALKHLGDLTDFQAVVCAYQGFEETQREVAKLFS